MAVGESQVRQSVVVGHHFSVPVPSDWDWDTPDSELMTNDWRLGLTTGPAAAEMPSPLPGR